MSEGGVSAEIGSIAIGGNASGPVVNVHAPKALNVAVTVEQKIDQQLPSFLGKLIVFLSRQSLSQYGKGPRRILPAEVSDKIKYNCFPPNHGLIRDFLRYSHLLETSYHGVEQYNDDARFLVRRRARDAYEAELLLASSLDVTPSIVRIEYVKANATTIVAKVITRLLQDYKSSLEVKVEQEIADLAVSLIVADAIVECEVLERPEDALTA
jgi:hypothetical protein